VSISFSLRTRALRSPKFSFILLVYRESPARARRRRSRSFVATPMKQLTSDNPEQQRRLDQLRPVIERKLDDAMATRRVRSHQTPIGP
jgi:hypothetical protein